MRTQKKTICLLLALVAILTSCTNQISVDLPPVVEDSIGKSKEKAENISDNLSLPDLLTAIVEDKGNTTGLTTEWSRSNSRAVFTYYSVLATFSEGFSVGDFNINSGALKITFETSTSSTKVNLQSFEASTVVPLEVEENTGRSVAAILTFGGVCEGKFDITENEDGTFSHRSASIDDIRINLGASVTVNGQTVSTTGPWQGGVDTAWYEENPQLSSYTISNPDQLAGLSKLVNSGIDFDNVTVYLDEDIDLSNLAWTPIGSLANDEIGPRDEGLVFGSDDEDYNGFKGVFDGQGHVVSNLYIKANKTLWFTPVNSFKGLFGILEPGSAVQNLTLTNVSIPKSNGFVGSIAGYVPSSSGEQEAVALKNITVNGDIEIYALFNVGGLVGRSESGSSINFENCSIAGTDGSYIESFSTSSIAFAGGLIGAEYSSSDSMLSNVSVRGTDVIGYYRAVGGIAGHINYATVSGCSVCDSVLKIKGDSPSSPEESWSIGVIAGTIGSDGQTSEAVEEAGVILAINGPAVAENVTLSFPFENSEGSWKPFCNGYVGTYRGDSIDGVDPSKSIEGLPSDSSGITLLFKEN